jgi:carboxyl-terminal processing protease
MQHTRKITCQKSILIALFCLPFLIATPSRSYGSSDDLQKTYKNLEVFSNILSIVQQNYVDEIDTQKAIEGAIKGMLTSLDPHSSFMKPDDFKELQVETKGSFSGIGIEITLKDDVLTVVSPIEGTPADKMGIKASDKIIKIEDEATRDMSLMEAVKKLRGPKGSEVTISIHREGWTDLKDFTIVRDVIPIHSVRSRMLEPGYGYVRITNFQRKTDKDLKNAIDELGSVGELNGLILDLRNNPGGLLDASAKVADLFLDEGVIVYTKGRLKDQNMELKAHSSSSDYHFPMVILVLGTQTFGKGSVQTIIPMADGAGLRLTTARYFTPKGTSIQATGITPDVVVTAVIPSNSSKTKKPKFFREKDLKHHLDNGGSLPKKDLKKQEPTGEDNKTESSTSKKQLDVEAQEKLQKDNQLKTALLVLKSLNVLSTPNQ